MRKNKMQGEGSKEQEQEEEAAAAIGFRNRCYVILFFHAA